MSKSQPPCRSPDEDESPLNGSRSFLLCSDQWRNTDTATCYDISDKSMPPPSRSFKMKKILLAAQNALLILSVAILFI
ncbi:hypothetical protein AXF42_Ash020514 [Apostasia shenzhenica]|uniref:Uncharacterized protein n=1 Tax=Apostasia shenzhenica TaxID=1088818 RepID=A0A2H9ZY05_9ASPA|nr:hypothetical protein AXF42_Ash020514 [Apostasia shenzhenica]